MTSRSADYNRWCACWDSCHSWWAKAGGEKRRSAVLSRDQFTVARLGSGSLPVLNGRILPVWRATRSGASDKRE